MIFSEFTLSESVNDAGIFKALFFAGIPGAGKTYVQQELQDGAIDARVVNTDKPVEALRLKKLLGELTTAHVQDDEQLREFLDTVTSDAQDMAKRVTKLQLSQYVNGVLPLMIDGTSSDLAAISRRVGLLTSFGYDVGMVYVQTDLETAMKAAGKRERAVDEEFIKYVHEGAQQRLEYLKDVLFHGRFFEVANNENLSLSTADLQALFKKSSKFFKSPVQNPIGRRAVRAMREQKVQYLTDLKADHGELTMQELQDLINSAWYAR